MADAIFDHGSRFTDQLRALEPLFHRAPNAHNCQPWALRYPSGAMDTVEVGWDGRYELGPSDPVRRDLRLLLGAFVESCLVVCGAEGVAARFVADHDAAGRRVGRLVAAPEPALTPFTVADVVARRTWRGRWADEPLPPEVTDELVALTAAAGGRLVTLDSAVLYPLLLEASRWFVANRDILAELRQWSRLSSRHPDYQRDGLSDVALALTRVEVWGLRTALRRRHPQPRRHGLRNALAQGQARPFRGGGPVLVLLVPAGTDAAGEVEFGRLVQRLWLTLTRQGLAAHPQSHLIDCPTTLGSVLALTSAVAERPLWIARVGRPDPERLRRVPLSARRVRTFGR